MQFSLLLIFSAGIYTIETILSSRSLASQQCITAQQAVKSKLRLLSQQHPTRVLRWQKFTQAEEWDQWHSLRLILRNALEFRHSPHLAVLWKTFSNQSPHFTLRRTLLLTGDLKQHQVAEKSVEMSACRVRASFLTHGVIISAVVGFQRISISILTCSTRMPMEPKEFGPNH